MATVIARIKLPTYLDHIRPLQVEIKRQVGLHVEKRQSRIGGKRLISHVPQGRVLEEGYQPDLEEDPTMILIHSY